MVSHRGISPTEKDQREDSAWDLASNPETAGLWKNEIVELLWKTPLCLVSILRVALMLRSIRIFSRF